MPVTAGRHRHVPSKQGVRMSSKPSKKYTKILALRFGFSARFHTSLEAKLKPIEVGSPVRVGVLSTNAILNAGLYQDKLQKEYLNLALETGNVASDRQSILQGFEVILPDKATMEHTIIPSTEAKSRKDIEGAQNLLRIAIHVVLPLRAVNTIILASDDLRDILPYDDPLLKKCVDPLDSLARSTVKLAQSVIQSF
ncbi:probable amino-acid racemase [Tanacetum coccineum]